MRFHSVPRTALRSHQGTIRAFPERLTAKNAASVRLSPHQLPRIRKREMARHKSMSTAESGLAAPTKDQEQQLSGCDNGGDSELVIILDGPADSSPPSMDPLF